MNREPEAAMRQKYYVWGFPGIGKSSVNSDLRIEDADCERFKFLVPKDAPLHSREIMEHAQRDPSYPENYWNYVRSVDADIVLLNCHISLLGAVDRDRLLLIYPAPELKGEFLRRYAQRGDNESYIHYMETAFEEIVAAARCSPYRKYEITNPHIYLHDLIERGTTMEQFITKKDLTGLLSECIQTGVYTTEGTAAGKTPEELAQMMFDGDLSLDIASLRTDLAEKKAQLEQERVLNERRGGLSHEDLSQKIMEGIVNGALDIRHCEAAPYSHGFEVTFRSAQQGSRTRWTCFCSLAYVAEMVTSQIERGTPPVDTHALLAEIDFAEQNKITSFVLERDSSLQRRSQYTGHVASAQDVHRGIALDGIILGHFQGDYSSITTGTQNDTVRALVALKGFCLDCVHKLPSRPLFLFVIDYLKDHGTDISTPEKLNAWIRENPDKCALPENRARTPVRLEGKSAKETKTETQKRKDRYER